MSEKLNDYLEEAIKNIREDRKKALSLLEDIADFIGQSQDRHKDVGATAAKYLETLQRSNEQLVKITTILQKSKNDEYGDLDTKETESLYDELEDS
jgi:F0F1-type ATP synthase membrane subunit b/b'